jgi:hypothetical protein
MTASFSALQSRRLDGRQGGMRIRWRRLLAKSWVVSRWHYKRHGLVLTGRPSDKIWYFAYGANMHLGTFAERRGIRPLASRVGLWCNFSALLPSGISMSKRPDDGQVSGSG